MQSGFTPSEYAGVHAIMVSDNERGLCMIEEMPPGGQLAANGVDAGDILRAVDGRPATGLSLKAIKSMIEGPPGSNVELLLRRRDGSEEFVVNVVRTMTMGEDVQIGVYTELQALLDMPASSADEGWQRMSVGPDEEEHASRIMHDAVFARVAAMRQDPRADALSDLNEQLRRARADAEAAQTQAWEADRIIRDLKAVIADRDTQAHALREELAFCTRNQMAAVSLTLEEDFERMAGEPAARAALEDSVQQDVAQALGVDASRIEVMGLHNKGGVVVDLCLVPDGSDRACNVLAQQIRQQVDDPSSSLHARGSTRRASKVMNRDPHDWIERLRATCEKLGNDNSVLAADLEEATKHVEEVRRHREGRAKQLESQNEELSREVERLTAEAAAQAEARKVQVEQLTSVRDDEEAKMRGSITALSSEVASQETFGRNLKSELERALGDLNQAAIEINRLTTDLELSRNREVQLQAEKVVLQQQHGEVVSAIEKSLSEAKSTIEKQRRDLADLDRMQQRLTAQADEMREVRKELAGVQAKALHDVEVLKVQHGQEKMQLAAKHEAETNEFLAHLGAAESTVASLRGELETRLRSQSELVRQQATQEELSRSQTTRVHQLETQMRTLKTQYDAAASSAQGLKMRVEGTQADLDASQAEVQKLRIERNAWQHVDRPRFEMEVERAEKAREEASTAATALEAQNEFLRERIAAMQAQLDAIPNLPPPPPLPIPVKRERQHAPLPANADAATLAERLAELERGLEDREAEAEDAQARVAALQRRVATLEREKGEALARLQAAGPGAPGAPPRAPPSNGLAAPAQPQDKTVAELRAMTARARELEQLLQSKERERARAVEEAETWKGAMSEMQVAKTRTAPLLDIPQLEIPNLWG